MRLTGYQVELRTVNAEDLDMLRAWRNDPAISQFMLSQETISKEQQRAWFHKIQRDPSQRHFIILYKSCPIGSANIKTRGIGKSLNEATTIEPGLYIADERYRQNMLAFAPTLLLNDYCFEVLGARKLKAVVRKENDAAIKYNQKLGYKTESSGELIEVSLNLEDYQSHSKLIKSLLSRQNRR